MPYGTKKVGKMVKVFNKDSGHVYGTHSSKAKANKQIAAIHANTNEDNSKSQFAIQPDPTAYQTYESPDGYHVMVPGGNEQWFRTPKLRDEYMKWHMNSTGISKTRAVAPKMSEVFVVKEAPIQNRPPPGAQPIKPTEYTQMGQRGNALKTGLDAMKQAGQEMTAYKSPSGEIDAYPKDAAPGRGPMKADITKGVWAPVTGTATGTPFSSQSPTTSVAK